MTNYRTLDNIEEDYFKDHPEEIDSYLVEMFERYAQDGDSSALLASLRVIAQETGMTRQGLQKALSNKGNPRLDNVNAIMHALGYRLTPMKL